MTVDELEKTLKSYAEIAESFSEEASNVLEEELELTKQRMGGERVLDAGCGPGTQTEWMAENGLEAVGIDLVPEMVEQARKRVSGAEFKIMDMRNLDFPENSFDAVWTCASLYHLDKEGVRKALKEFHRVLKPGGVLSIYTEIGGKGGEWIDPSEHGKPLHRYIYSETFLRNSLIKNGFKIQESQKYDLVESWIHMMSSKNVNADTQV